MDSEGQSGVKPTLRAQDLLATMPSLRGIADIEAKQMALKPSCALTLNDIAVLAEAVTQANRSGYDGSVVTQGTDTMEETSFALDLLAGGTGPVVMTGAMFSPSHPGNDGEGNLQVALRAATAAQLAAAGVLVAMDQELHSASHVIKCDTVRRGAFASPLCGPIGRVVEARVVLFASMVKRPDWRPAIRPDATFARVAVLTSLLDGDSSMVDAVLDAGYSGLIVAGMGVGHVPPAVADRLEQATRHIPVVLCARNAGGQVCFHTYGYSGGEMDLLGRCGLVSGGWLSPLKARILLAMALTEGMGKENIAQLFVPFDGGPATRKPGADDHP